MNDFNDKEDKLKDIDEEFDYTHQRELSTKDVDKLEKKLRNNRNSIGIKIYSVLVTCLLGVLFCTSTFFYKKINEEKQEVSQYVEINENNGSEVKCIVKDYMANGKGTMAMLRELFPENIVVAESNKYLFIPVIENFLQNKIKNENIVTNENGEIQYIVDDKIKSHKGIDVSKYQGEIDWEKVAADGVEFAMIRLGYRGYGSGALVIDEMAMANIENATKAGIKVGIYFFSQAVTQEEAVEEAKFVTENIKKYKITYPIVFDTEDILNEDTRTEGLTQNELSRIAVAFCKEIKDEGYTPAIYANLRWFALSLDMSLLEDYDKWYAYYDSELYFPYKISMWQYTENGKVDGISGTVDLNISFKDWE